jgi:diaminopimelate epimerase
MILHFYKYQGAGNDFVMVDNREKSFPVSTDLINRLCDRRFGIGADGLILLQNHPGYDFEMVYFNSDGNLSSMCGNGGRCLAAFAKYLGIGGNELSFIAVDGPHKAYFIDDLVSLQMIDVKEITSRGEDLVLNTGSPHYVRFVSDVNSLDIVKLAKEIRYNNEFKEKGINVNFVEVDPIKPNSIKLRTYERGVEDETLACGTGVVASSIAFYHRFGKDKTSASSHKISVKAAGGNLEVSFDFSPDTSYTNVWLTGPAERAFEGDIAI